MATQWLVMLRVLEHELSLTGLNELVFFQYKNDESCIAIISSLHPAVLNRRI
jgi:hypothetical protein